ncbi:hypothetical protein GON26_06485 [Flavobacterium sp. GA093]|uniref:Uncharacterized protein n=1 Tax=Flavobacterium hydrocarbonoxydans TaxID=2683249 RepID=A0A6I4NJ67_9FLAO|nr:hypothetical protein [Flavobacterium hydrocarbonoxydans]MWB94003.1 hypothetical protein [Flavobacterium hydrocarbonoxydans]
MSYLVSQMVNTLANKVLRLEKANSDRDYSGGGWYEEIKHAIFLYSDFSAVYKYDSFRSVSGGGLSLPSESSSRNLGRWNVSEEFGRLYLEIIFDDNSQQKLETKDLGPGLQKLGDQVWNRYLIG